MSRRTIRAAMTAWLAPPNVAGINTVYRGFPKIIPATAFTAGTVGSLGGCVAVVHIAGDVEKRVAMGGPTSGKKRIDHRVEFHLFARWTAPAALGSDMGLDLTDAFDDIVDALKARIRADRTANSNAIWQWGEADLSGRYGEAVRTPEALEQWASIATTVTEWLTT